MMMSPTLMPMRNSIRFSAGTSALRVDHAALNLDGAAHRVDDAGELHQQAVAGGLDDATAVLVDLGIDEFAPMRIPLGERALLVRTHKATVAGDIGRENGREPSRHALVGQSAPPSMR